MNTNHQLVRGNYTAKADSMGAGQIRGSQKSLLWDKTDTMLSADRRKTGETEACKSWQNICGQKVQLRNKNQPPEFKWVIMLGLSPCLGEMCMSLFCTRAFQSIHSRDLFFTLRTGWKIVLQKWLCGVFF